MTTLLTRVLASAAIASIACLSTAYAQEPPAAGISPRVDAIRKSGVLKVGVLANLPWLAENTSGQGEAWDGPAWTLATSRSVRAFVSPEQNALIENELKFQRERRQTRLPNGAIHADLFRDNVLFDGDRLSGLIDFGFAATDEFAYDLAITANDWCIDAEGRFVGPLLTALLAAYFAERPLSEAEQAAWPALLRAGALRFWLSRLYDLHLPRAAEINTPHDPMAFERILRLRIEQPAHWPVDLVEAAK